MKEKFVKLFTNKIFIISSIILLLIGVVVGVSFAWVGRTSESQLQAIVSKVLVDSDFVRIIDTNDIDNIMPGDKISGEIYVQLKKASRPAYIRVKLSLDIDREKMGDSFKLSDDQEKWLQEINFNLCDTHVSGNEEPSYCWSAYRGGYYYLLTKSNVANNETMLKVDHQEGQTENYYYKLTDGVEIDFDSNMLFTDDHGNNIPFVLNVETQAIQADYLYYEYYDETSKTNVRLNANVTNNRVLVGQLMNEVIGETVQESYIVSFDTDGGNTIRSITIPFLDSLRSDIFVYQYNLENVINVGEVYVTLYDLVLPDNPTKAESAFMGWKYRPKGSGDGAWVDYNEENFKVYSDLEFKAQWSEQPGVHLRFRFAQGEESNGVILKGDGFVAKNQSYKLPYYVYNGMELVWFETFEISATSVMAKWKCTTCGYIHETEKLEGDACENTTHCGGTEFNKVKLYYEGGTSVTISEDTTYYGAWYYIGRSFSASTSGRTRVATITDLEYMRVFRGNEYVYDIPVAAYVDNITVLEKAVALGVGQPYFMFYSIDMYKDFKAKIKSIETVIEEGETPGDEDRILYKVTFEEITDSVGNKFSSNYEPGKNPYNTSEDILLETEAGSGAYFSQRYQPSVGDHLYINTTFDYNISSEVAVNVANKTNLLTFTDEQGNTFNYSFEPGKSGGIVCYPAASFPGVDVNVLLYSGYNGEIELTATLSSPITIGGMEITTIFKITTTTSRTMSVEYALPYIELGTLKVKSYKYDGYVDIGASSCTPDKDGAFVINSGVITSYKDRFISILLPGKINDNVVTGIGESVFINNQYLKRLIIPATADFTEAEINDGAESKLYASMGNSVFQNCSALETIVMGTNVKVFSERMFKNCSSLKSITIPENIVSIGDEAFSGCVKIEEVYYNTVNEINFESTSQVFSNVGRDTAGVEVYIGDKVVSIPNHFMYAPAGSEPKVLSFYCRGALTGIGNNAFKDNPYIKQVFISTCENLKTIGEYAFYNCQALQMADLPTRTRSTSLIVGNYAFANTTRLYSVDFGESVTKIGSFSYNKSSISSIILPNSLTEVGESAFEGCHRVTYLAIGEKLTSGIKLNAFNDLKLCSYVSIASNITVGMETTIFKNLGADLPTNEGVAFVFGNRVTSIPSNLTRVDGVTAENKRIRITSVIIGEKVQSIGNKAFYNCTDLVSLLILSKGLNTIGSDAFFNCSSLISLTIPSTVSVIGDKAFYNCVSLEKLYFNAKSCKSFLEGSDVFYSAGSGSRNLEVTVGEGVERLPNNFMRSSNLEESPLAKKIYYNATTFRGDPLTEKSAVFSLIGRSSSVKTEIIFGDNVEAIPDYLFYSGIYLHNGDLKYESLGETNGIAEANLTKVSISLESVVIGKRVTKIGNYAFYGLDAVEVDFGDNLKTIGNYAFFGCKNLSDITLKDSVTKIGDRAFYNARQIKQLTIGEGVTEIGERAFANMVLLQRIYYNAVKCEPASGGAIFESAGYDYTGGTSLVFGSRVQFVPDYFINSNSTNIKVVQISDSVKYIGIRAFANCLTIRNVKMGAGVEEIREDAFNGCGMTSIIIPAMVTRIGTGAFYNCFNVEVIEFNSEYCEDFAAVNRIFERRVNESTSGCKEATLIIGSTVRKLPANMIEYFEVLDGTGRVYSAYINRVVINAVNLLDTAGATSPLSGVGKDVVGGATVTFSDSVLRVPTMIFNKSNIISVYLGRSVTSIGAMAFSECSELKTITFSQAITTIGDYAFDKCKKMRNTNAFPEFVSTVGKAAFRECESLSFELYLTGVKEIKEYSFYKTGITHLTIGKDVKSIEKYAFAECDYLANIEFNAINCSYPVVVDPNTNQAIDPVVFACSATKVERVVNINESVTYLPGYFMANTKNLSLVYLNPRQLDSVGMFAFMGCGVYVANFKIVFGEYLTRVPDNLFAGTAEHTSGITEIEFTNKITIIGNNAFAYCTRLVDLPLTTYIVQILDKAFYSCTSLKRINIPNAVTLVGVEAFYGCTSAESITLGVGLKNIGRRAFAECTNVYLTSVNCENLLDFKPDSEIFANLGSTLGSSGGRTGGTLSVGESVLQIPEYFMSAYTGQLTTTACLGLFGGSCSAACNAAREIAPRIYEINVVAGCSMISKFAFACNPYIQNVILPGTVTSMDGSAFYHVGAAISRSADITIKGKLLYSDGSLYNNGVPVVVTFKCEFMDFTKEDASGKVPKAPASTIGSAQSGTAAFLTSYGLYATPILNEDGVISVRVFREGRINGSFTVVKNITYTVRPTISAIDIEVALPVVSVGDYAFYNTDIESISLPEGVTSIEAHAFEKCEELLSISFPTTVNRIGASAFYDCKNLSILHISSKVSHVGNMAFANLENLEVLDVSSNLLPDGDSSTQLFTNMGCKTLSGTIVTFKAEVTKIPTYFLYSSNPSNGTNTGVKLNSITIEGNVEVIPKYAFYGCGGFTTISLPNYVQKIDESAFEKAINLTTISYGVSLATIGDKAFKETGITTIEIPSTVATVGVEAYMECRKAERIVIPSSVTYLGKNAFSNCINVLDISYNAGNIPAFLEGETPFTNLAANTAGASVTFGSSVEVVSEGLFRQSNAKLSQVVFAGGTKTIGSYAFESVSGLTEVLLPGGLEAINSYAFYNCADLARIDLGATVAYIGGHAFGYTVIEELTLPESITAIEELAFAEMNLVSTLTYSVGNFTSNFRGEGEITYENYYRIFDTDFGKNADSLEVIITSNVISIPVGMMMDVTSCETLTFVDAGLETNKLEFIGAYAFSGTSITSVTLPYNLKNLSFESFSRTTSLSSIVVESVSITNLTSTSDVFKNSGNNIAVEFTNNVIRVPDYIFYNVTGVTSLQLGSNINSIGKAAFCMIDIDNLTIPESVVTIQPLAFAGIMLVNINYKATAVSDFNLPYYNVFFDSMFNPTITIADNVLTIPSYLMASADVSSDVYRDPTAIEGYIDAVLNATEIEEDFAFKSGTINTLTIGSGVSRIGKAAFANITNINSVRYNATTVLDLEEQSQVFRSATISNLVFGDNVESIPANLFYVPDATADDTYTIRISQITIGQNVSDIGANAFTRVSNVDFVYYKATALSEYATGRSPFEGFGGMSLKVIISGNVESIPANFMSGAIVISIVFNYTTTTNIVSIGDSAFANNANLSYAAFNGLTPPTSIGYQVFGDPTNEYFTIKAPISTQPEMPPDEEEENPGEGEEGAGTPGEGGDGVTGETPDEEEGLEERPPGPYELAFPDYVVDYYIDSEFETNYLPVS